MDYHVCIHAKKKDKSFNKLIGDLLDTGFTVYSTNEYTKQFFRVKNKTSKRLYGKMPKYIRFKAFYDEENPTTQKLFHSIKQIFSFVLDPCAIKLEIIISKE